MVGVDADRRSIGRLGLGWFAFRSKHRAEIAQRVRVARIQCDRTAVGMDRLVQLQLVLQHDPKVAVPVRLLWLEGNASLDQRDRVVAPPTLMGQDA